MDFEDKKKCQNRPSMENKKKDSTLFLMQRYISVSDDFPCDLRSAAARGSKRTSTYQDIMKDPQSPASSKLTQQSIIMANRFEYAMAEQLNINNDLLKNLYKTISVSEIALS